MDDGAPQLVVVLAPETADEASRLFSALLAGGFHPTIDYGEGGPASAALANYPILVPQPELAEAKAYLRGVRASGPPAAKRPSMFGEGLSDRPTGVIPPWKFKETVGKALGVLLALLLLVGGIVALVEMLQYLSSLRGH